MKMAIQITYSSIVCYAKEEKDLILTLFQNFCICCLERIAMDGGATEIEWLPTLNLNLACFTAF